MRAELRAEFWRACGRDLLAGHFLAGHFLAGHFFGGAFSWHARGLFDAFRGRPRRQDPLRILRFSDPHFRIFGAARHDFIKKKVAALGKTRGSRHSQVTIFAATFAFSSGPKRVTYFLQGKKLDLNFACLGE